MQQLNLLNSIHFKNLRGDIFGGVTTAIVSLPMALAFGVAAFGDIPGGAAAGLYGAVLVGFFAAFFGGTPTLISEPTGPMTVVMTAVIANLTASNPENGLAMAFTVVMLAGVFQIIFGSLRLGKYVTMMPYSVISGFMSGIGVILIILQLGPFLGHPNPKGGVLGALQALPSFIANLNPLEAILGAVTVALIFLTPNKLKRFVPPQLVALIVGTLMSVFLFGGADIRRIGQISAGLPSLNFPTFSPDQIQVMLLEGAVLGMLGCIDSLLTSVIADSLTQTEHNSNKELIGQGIGNIASGLFGGLPGAGATMGTVVNIQTGARTALSGLTRAVILAIVVMWAAGLTQAIPLAVLAGIALKVGIDIIDWKFLRRAHYLSLKTAAIMYSVMALTVFVDLIVAVGVGVFVANILTINRLAQIQEDKVKAIDHHEDEEAEILCDEGKELLKQADGKILILDLGGPLSFGAAKAITQRQTILDRYQALILDLTHVPMLGVTATLALEKLIDDAYSQSLDVYIVGSEGKVKKRLQRFNILDRIPHQNRVNTRLNALRQALGILNGGIYPDSPKTDNSDSTESMNGSASGVKDSTLV